MGALGYHQGSPWWFLGSHWVLPIWRTPKYPQIIWQGTRSRLEIPAAQLVSASDVQTPRCCSAVIPGKRKNAKKHESSIPASLPQFFWNSSGAEPPCVGKSLNVMIVPYTQGSSPFKLSSRQTSRCLQVWVSKNSPNGPKKLQGEGPCVMDCQTPFRSAQQVDGAQLLPISFNGSKCLLQTSNGAVCSGWAGNCCRIAAVGRCFACNSSQFVWRIRPKSTGWSSFFPCFNSNRQNFVMTLTIVAIWYSWLGFHEKNMNTLIEHIWTSSKKYSLVTLQPRP